MRKIRLLVLNLIWTVNILHGQEEGFKTGDFLFVDLDCGRVCEAIEDVTLEQFGVNGPRLSHVGLIEKRGAQVLVWEAWPKGGVQVTPLKEVLSRPASSVLHLPLRQEFEAQAKIFIRRLTQIQGSKYDVQFFTGNSTYYCSELFSEFWPEIFKNLPMYFGEIESSAYVTWKLYYQNELSDIPRGSPGLSPLGVYIQGANAGLFLKKDARELKK